MKSASGSPKQFLHGRVLLNLASLTINSATSKDEELFTFLNTPNSSPKKTTAEISMSPPTPSSLMVEHPTDTTDSVSELSIHSGRSSPSLMHTSVEVPDDLNHDNVNIRNENLYKKEIMHKLNNEIEADQTLGIVLNNGK